MRIINWYILFVILLSLKTLALYGQQDNSYIMVRSYYPTSSSLDYQNLYLYSAVHYSPLQNIVIHLTLKKGQGEPGYYPVGYFKDANRGFYENGSYYILLKDSFMCNKIILGNYIPKFGQGLLFGSNFPLFLSNPYYELARYRDGIYQTGSSSKTILLEGIALEYEYGNMYFRPFFSWNRYDCSEWEEFPREYSCKTNLFTCIRGVPDYESPSNREKRNNLAEYIAGINVSARWDGLKAGSTVTYTRFNRLIDPYYNFDPGEGDKTGHWYRGKDLLSSNIYFKLYRPVELFGEVVWTLHSNLSYYPEFNGGYTSALGFSGGARRKINNTGMILWGAYLPANLVNPHALELPDGLNNLACGLLGIHYSKSARKFTSWIYAYSELYNKDNPDDEEGGLAYSYSLQYPFVGKTTLKVKQSFEVIDHYYYAPDVWSYKISSKVSVKYLLTAASSLIFRVENRMGSPGNEKLKIGTGVSAEVLYDKKEFNMSFQLMYYFTDNDRFAYLYPYEKPLYKWSFMPTALHGNGFLSLFTFVKDFKDNFTSGAKLKYNLNFSNGLNHKATIYVISEYSF